MKTTLSDMESDTVNRVKSRHKKHCSAAFSTRDSADPLFGSNFQFSMYFLMSEPLFLLY